MIKYIVTGTGRCGTVFMAKLLTSLGVSCGHESIFDYSTEDVIINRIKGFDRTLSLCSQNKNFFNERTDLNWIDPNTIIAESSYLAAPYLNNPLIKNVPVIHLVRNPLDVISSFLLDFKYFEFEFPNKKNIYNSKGWENKIYEVLPELHSIKTPIERACWFYCKWNEMILDSCRNRPYLLLKIENLKYDSLFNFLSLKEINKENMFKDKKSNTNKPKNINSKRICFSDIPERFIENVFFKKYFNLLL